ncbi:Disintegrin and metalloproteinase domain-containing protein 10 [Trichoplax sp. H2]|uniref:Peptidase M12B domain-containing protein n=1 Tax=Trichoplax adhaerens TaxID=10228 RepID=B3SCY0_TRIAD|nr:predicted protein [Trichoplax adhaerens]EDV19423.1 predicted protein [Trichoplax adhaerens]RDD39097.1 Disintegrin and metalloproteinase domain-containing protein 10 [Trichoplax sp. H2]|eukprot:XP_002118112.1 predicted protein [Trichoplax adhaerens]
MIKSSLLLVITIISCDIFLCSSGKVAYLKDYQVPKFTSYSKALFNSSNQHSNVYQFELQVEAYNRVFKLVLHSQSLLFHSDLVLEFDPSTIASFDRSHFVYGSIQSHPETEAFGYIYNSGQFQGVFTLDRVKYYVEYAKFFPSLASNGNQFIIYRNIDISSRFRASRDVQSSDRWLHDPLFSSFASYNHHLNTRQARQQNHNFNNINNTCLARIDIDRHVLQRYGDPFHALIGISVLLQGVNQIFRKTDFNGDGQADSIGIAIQSISAKTNFSRLDPIANPTYYFNNWTAYYNYSQYCMGFLFIDHHFKQQVTGIANSGYKIDEGICTKYHYEDNGVLSSSNVGLLSVSRLSKTLIYPLREMIAAHEIGHIFGSKHDNFTKLCSPTGEKGFYLMHAAVSSGEKMNNYLFSPCSRQAIYHSIVTKGWNKQRGCLINQHYPICGNGIIDEGEECDCGYQSNCNDSCCTPAFHSFMDMSGNAPCRRIPNCNQSNQFAIIYVVAGLIGTLIISVFFTVVWKQCIRKSKTTNNQQLMDLIS